MKTKRGGGGILIMVKLTFIILKVAITIIIKGRVTII